MKKPHQEFWELHPGLVWSNPDAPDSVLIRAALLRPRFQTLLDVAMEFSLERLQQEWELLKTDPEVNTRSAQPIVERCLRNIEQGWHHAAA